MSSNPNALTCKPGKINPTNIRNYKLQKTCKFQELGHSKATAAVSYLYLACLSHAALKHPGLCCGLEAFCRPSFHVLDT